MKTAAQLFRILILGMVGILVLGGAARVEADCEVTNVNEGPPLVVTFTVRFDPGSAAQHQDPDHTEYAYSE